MDNAKFEAALASLPLDVAADIKTSAESGNDEIYGLISGYLGKGIITQDQADAICAAIGFNPFEVTRLISSRIPDQGKGFE